MIVVEVLVQTYLKEMRECIESNKQKKQEVMVVLVANDEFVNLYLIANDEFVNLYLIANDEFVNLHLIGNNNHYLYILKKHINYALYRVRTYDLLVNSQMLYLN